MPRHLSRTTGWSCWLSGVNADSSNRTTNSQPERPADHASDELTRIFLTADGIRERVSQHGGPYVFFLGADQASYALQPSDPLMVCTAVHRASEVSFTHMVRSSITMTWSADSNPASRGNEWPEAGSAGQLRMAFGRTLAASLRPIDIHLSTFCFDFWSCSSTHTIPFTTFIEQHDRFILRHCQLREKADSLLITAFRSFGNSVLQDCGHRWPEQPTIGSCSALCMDCSHCPDRYGTLYRLFTSQMKRCMKPPSCTRPRTVLSRQSLTYRTASTQAACLVYRLPTI